MFSTYQRRPFCSSGVIAGSGRDGSFELGIWIAPAVMPSRFSAASCAASCGCHMMIWKSSHPAAQAGSVTPTDRSAIAASPRIRIIIAPEATAPASARTDQARPPVGFEVLLGHSHIGLAQQMRHENMRRHQQEVAADIERLQRDTAPAVAAARVM